MKKITSLIMALALGSAGVSVAHAAPTPPSNAKSCLDNGYVWVVVDNGQNANSDEYGNGLEAGCALKFQNGRQALESAGHTADAGSLITTINDVTIDWNKTQTYWSYWQGAVDDSGNISWSYSQWGADMSKPQPGAVELWLNSARPTSQTQTKVDQNPPAETIVAPTVATQPTDAVVNENLKHTFTVDVNGSAPMTWVWEAQKPGATEWETVDEGKDLDSYEYTAATADNGMKLRARISNDAGEVTTDEVEVTVIGAQYVNIPDARLRKCVADASGEAENMISKGGMAQVDEFSCSGSDRNGRVEDLTGLEYLTGAVKIALTGNSLEDDDLTVFAENEWPNLDNLVLTTNQITDIKDIAGLDLSTLFVAGNQITDLTVLNEMTRLKNLNARNNKVTSLSGVKLAALDELSIDDNLIADTLDLSGFPALAYVVAHGTKSDDPAKVRNGFSKVTGVPTTLTKFFAMNNNIDDVSEFAKAAGLQSVRLDNNAIMDISPLKNAADFSVRYQKVYGDFFVNTEANAPVPMDVNGSRAKFEYPVGKYSLSDDGSKITWKEESPENEPFSFTWTGAKNFGGTYYATVKPQPEGKVIVQAVDEHGSVIKEKKIAYEKPLKGGAYKATNEFGEELTVEGESYTLKGLAKGSAQETGNVVEGTTYVKYEYTLTPETSIVSTTVTAAPVTTTVKAEPVVTTTIVTPEAVTTTVTTGTETESAAPATSSLEPTSTATDTSTKSDDPVATWETTTVVEPTPTVRTTETKTETQTATETAVSTATVENEAAEPTAMVTVTTTPTVTVTTTPVATAVQTITPTVTSSAVATTTVTETPAPHTTVVNGTVTHTPTVTQNPQTEVKKVSFAPWMIALVSILAVLGLLGFGGWWLFDNDIVALPPQLRAWAQH